MNDKYLKVEVHYPHQVGGQQVGDSPIGVWVTHLPTGLKAFCDHERSQLRNKRIAMSMIEWGLAELKFEEPNPLTP